MGGSEGNIVGNKRFNCLGVAFMAGIALCLATPVYAQEAGKVLVGIDLSGFNLSGVDLSDANLTNVNLAEANLSGANFSGAKFNNVILAGVHLEDTNLTEVHFTGKTPLKGVSLSMLVRTGLDLSGVDLRGVDRAGYSPFQGKCAVRLSVNLLKDPDLNIDPKAACLELTDEHIVQIFRDCLPFVYADIMSEWRWIDSNPGHPRRPARKCILESLQQ
jgi:hypothetical protein